MADHTLNITGVTDVSLIKKWQRLAAKRMWEFTRRGFPLRSRLTGRELYIDTSITGTLSLSGTVPLAGQSKRFKAPVDERVPSPLIRVKLPIGWRMGQIDQCSASGDTARIIVSFSNIA